MKSNQLSTWSDRSYHQRSGLTLTTFDSLGLLQSLGLADYRMRSSSEIFQKGLALAWRLFFRPRCWKSCTGLWALSLICFPEMIVFLSWNVFAVLIGLFGWTNSCSVQKLYTVFASRLFLLWAYWRTGPSSQHGSLGISCWRITERPSPAACSPNLLLLIFLSGIWLKPFVGESYALENLMSCEPSGCGTPFFGTAPSETVLSENLALILLLALLSFRFRTLESILQPSCWQVAVRNSLLCEPLLQNVFVLPWCVVYFKATSWILHIHCT